MLSGVFNRLAAAGKAAVTRALHSQSKDQHLSFLHYSAIPRLRTLAIAPEDIHSTEISVSYSHEHRKLFIKFSDEQITFVFRENDVMVLASKPFDYVRFSEKLEEALLSTQRTKTAAAHQHSLSRG